MLRIAVNKMSTMFSFMFNQFNYFPLTAQNSNVNLQRQLSTNTNKINVNVSSIFRCLNKKRISPVA